MHQLGVHAGSHAKQFASRKGEQLKICLMFTCTDGLYIANLQEENISQVNGRVSTQKEMAAPLECARFPNFLQNFGEPQILCRLCFVVFLAFTLRLPIQTSLSVAPKLQVFVRSGKKCQKFRKTRAPLVNICYLHSACICQDIEISL